MSQKRSMPTVNKIVDFWNEKYNLDFCKNYCWGCGFSDLKLERAHLLARSSGGEDNEDNLVLLCRQCHHGTQEYFSTTIDEAEMIRNKILDGMPFFSIHFKNIAEKTKLGFYDYTYEKMGINKNDYLIFKKQMELL